MSTTGGLRLAFVIEAIDKATKVVAKVIASVDRLRAPAQRVSQTFGALQQTIGGVVSVGLRMSAVLAGAFYGVARMSETIDNLGDFADNLRISTTEVQELRYALRKAGGDADGLNTALDFLNRTIGEASNGNKEALTWFNAMGVSMAQLRRESPVEILQRLAEFASKLPETAHNTATLGQAAQALLGRGGKSMLQFLRLGKKGLQEYADEAHRTNNVLSDEAVRDFGAFNDELKDARAGLFNGLAAPLRVVLPLLNKLLGHVNQLVARNQRLIETKLTQWLERLDAALPSLLEGFNRFWQFMGRMVEGADRVAQALGGWGNALALLVGFIGAKAIIEFGLLTRAVWALGVALWANPLGVMLGVVLAIVAALPLMVMHWDTIIARLRKVREEVRGLFPDWMNKFVDQHGPGSGVEGYVTRAAVSGVPASGRVPGSGGGRTDVGGSLTITIDNQGRARVSELSKAPWSPMELNVGYTGGPLAMPN